jgi:hexosaminidase
MSDAIDIVRCVLFSLSVSQNFRIQQYHIKIENSEVTALRTVEHTKDNFTESECIGQTALCRYAEKRGVNVLAEIDVPGHARSW